ncbi:CHAT domain-containing protein [Leptolyngbya sp. FACHB-261]|uniref:CHAT domain-containing protein n=1 Tax=Leptolyngbya sp. FACHB-261 TaxID=2692806 RepID=UPI001683571F|nr:CHAT domain-containing protein [Leptolyngbya sp. FACHB-261]MBD2103733.1 CHAT domain-containing protein [Leptolyngbya sp. FACHB-261]
MFRQRYRTRPYQILGILFFSSLALCLWLGPVVWQNGRPKLGSMATAQVMPQVKAQVKAQAQAATTAQADSQHQQVQQGVERYQAGDFQGAVERWQPALVAYRNANRPTETAIVLENLARAYQQLGQIDRSISHWEQAIATSRQLGDSRQVARLLTEQAQSYSSLGQHRQAIALLCGAYGEAHNCAEASALQLARSQQDRPTEAAALGSLGNAYRLSGEYGQAIEYLNAGLQLARELNQTTYTIAALNDLGNAHASLAQSQYRQASSAEQRGGSNEASQLRTQGRNQDSQALQYFQESLQLARSQKDQSAQLRALLNLVPTYHRSNDSDRAAESLQQAVALLDRLPDDREKVYAAVDLASLLQPALALNLSLAGPQCLQSRTEPQAIELLSKATAIAQRIQDRRSESFALGKLGHIYECRQDYTKALELTRQAQWAADQNLLAKDSLYLWEWQAGRIFKAQNRQPEAIQAYEQAVNTLETIRGDILIASRDLQFDFRDTVDPIYRDLAELRLSRALLPSVSAKDRTQELSSVLNTIDSLKLAELQNYFGNDCVLAVGPQPLNQDSIGSATAIINSIIFRDRTAILVSLPDGEKKLHWLNIDNERLRQTINEFRRILERRADLIYDPTLSRQVYDWIIRPFAEDLARTQTTTLVFVQDGILRSVPMAALHDGQQFLIQKYAVATTASLTLTDAKALDRQGLRALALGLTEESAVDGRTFPALSNVGLEIDQVETELPGSKQLLNQEFTRERLRQELTTTSYPILHIATHGEFGSEPENTFLVMGNNDKLTINDLDAVIRSVNRKIGPVELLTLTACQTAAGDDRAALGLAGVAIQAGVKSALASLWYIDDAVTAELVTQFYDGLRDAKLSKAEALRAAQQAVINKGGFSAHPAYWAPFTLIGNWL